jgi:carbon storage regulator
MDMLVLTRKVGEQIVVPQYQLTVTVVGITGNRVRLGISAPHDVVVHRQEVQQRISTGASPVGEDRLRSARVLIADPDKFLLAMYGSHLRQLGAAVSTARTGLECLEKLQQAVPDVLVLEPGLPWGGGDGVLALLNEQPSVRPTVVILLTQGQNRGLLYRMSSFKIDDYQSKPLTATRLTERICTLLLSHNRGAVAPSDGTAWNKRSLD